MQLNLVNIFFGLAIAGVSSALPYEDAQFYSFLDKRAFSTDATCGNVGAGANKGLTCDPNLASGGGCCSASGYCGTSTDYCGAGCQSAFGICSGSESLPTDPNLCGATNGAAPCLSGLCCSAAGYCGNTTDYCTGGCQAKYGSCTTTLGGNGAGTCGPTFNNALCPTGQCCSTTGYCGTTETYCADPDCQWQYGTCDSSATPAGASTLTDPRPLLGSVSYDNDIYDCVQDHVVALTYDDGPYLYTNELLDTLKTYGFHATFFISGNNIGKGPIDTTAPYPSIIQRMIAEGHQVASHTWSHYSLQNIPSAMRKQQMGKNERALANIIGKYPTYMRPPYSQCDAASGCQADMKALGYHRIYFDLDTQDYLNPLPSQIQTSKSIVQAALAVGAATDFLSIQHDIVQQSVANLTSYYFGLIQSKGWKGVTAGECLGDPEANWYRTPLGMSAPTTSTLASSSSPTSSQASLTSLTTASSSSVTSSPQGSATPTTTSQASSTVIPTTSSTVTPLTTSTIPSTSIAVPTAAPSCVVKAGNFCGTIDPFGDKLGCQKSASSCYVQSNKCPQQAGKKNNASCKAYKQICQDLTTYCSTCGFTCSSTTFSPSAVDSEDNKKKDNKENGNNEKDGRN